MWMAYDDGNFYEVQYLRGVTLEQVLVFFLLVLIPSDIGRILSAYVNRHSLVVEERSAMV